MKCSFPFLADNGFPSRFLIFNETIEETKKPFRADGSNSQGPSERPALPGRPVLMRFPPGPSHQQPFSQHFFMCNPVGQRGRLMTLSEAMPVPRDGRAQMSAPASEFAEANIKVRTGSPDDKDREVDAAGGAGSALIPKEDSGASSFCAFQEEDGSEGAEGGRLAAVPERPLRDAPPTRPDQLL